MEYKRLFKNYRHKLYWLIILVFAGWLLFFIYNNLYLTMNNIKVLKEVKRKVAETIVNIKTWESLEKNIEWKKQPLADGDLGFNPFE